MEMPPQSMSGITQALLQKQQVIYKGIGNEWLLAASDTNEDIIQGLLSEKYLELRGQMRQTWGDFSAEGLAWLSNKVEELTGLLQQRYGGWSKTQLEREIDAWLYSGQHPRRAATSFKTAVEEPMTRPLPR